MKPALWQPSQTHIESTHIWQFMQHTNAKHGLTLQTYTDLHQWSIQQKHHFWSDLWDTVGIVASKKGDCIVSDDDLMPGAQWFPQAKLNFAANLLKYKDEQTALVFCGEDGHRHQISYAQLYTA